MRLARSNLLYARWFSNSGTLGTKDSTPRRALLYMPGNDERKVTKAAKEMDVDVVCMDCEDAVALNRKAEARGAIARMLTTLQFGRSEAAVRINPPATADAEQDLAAILAPQPLARLQALVCPKVNSARDIEWLYDRVERLAGGRLRELPRPPALISMVEDAEGLLNLRAVFEAALAAQAPLRLQACIFGGDDYAASIGAQRTAGSHELLTARQMVVMTCRAYGLQPIDIVQIDYKDTDALAREAREGASMGFAGKQVIHPAQVGPVQRAFSPSAEQLEWARGLVSAFNAHQQSGVGAFVYAGKMIDNPTFKQAQNILALDRDSL